LSIAFRYKVAIRGEDRKLSSQSPGSTYWLLEIEWKASLGSFSQPNRDIALTGRYVIYERHSLLIRSREYIAH
jgi:hypothetical protein